MKKATINKQKVSVFEEKELYENLLLNKQQVDLVLTYQRKFPELLKEEKGFCINGRQLWIELGQPQGDFSNWVARKVLKKNYKENVEYTLDHKIVEQVSGGKHVKEYNFTSNCAKKIAMRENTDNGDLVADYFILIEDTLRNYKDWTRVRDEERSNWNEMREEKKQWCLRKGYDSSIKKFYADEANMINISLLGYSAVDINYMLKNDDRLTRNHLSTAINDAINDLQMLNIGLIRANMLLDERRKIIELNCQSKYSHIKTEFQNIINNKAI